MYHHILQKVTFLFKYFYLLDWTYKQIIYLPECKKITPSSFFYGGTQYFFECTNSVAIITNIFPEICGALFENTLSYVIFKLELTISI